MKRCAGRRCARRVRQCQRWRRPDRGGRSRRWPLHRGVEGERCRCARGRRGRLAAELELAAAVDPGVVRPLRGGAGMRLRWPSLGRDRTGRGGRDDAEPTATFVDGPARTGRDFVDFGRAVLKSGSRCGRAADLAVGPVESTASTWWRWCTAWASLSRMSSSTDAGHELRTPVANIRAHAELALRHASSVPCRSPPRPWAHRQRVPAHEPPRRRPTASRPLGRRVPPPNRNRST